MARLERQFGLTPNQKAERIRKNFQEVRALADAFELQLTYMSLGFIPKELKVVNMILPDEPRRDTGVPQLWQLTYRNEAGDICTTSLRKYGGKGPADRFVSFEMRDSSTGIEWDMYGERTITES